MGNEAGGWKLHFPEAARKFKKDFFSTDIFPNKEDSCFDYLSLKTSRFLSKKIIGANVSFYVKFGSTIIIPMFFFFLCDIENKTKMCDWEIMRKTEAQEGAGGRYYRVASRSTQKQEPFFVMLSLPSFHSCSPLSK